MRAYDGKRVTLGIRPEDLHIARPTDPVGTGIDAEVEVVEQLGSEILLDMKVGSEQMVASIEPTRRVKVHDKLRLSLDLDRLHFFDLESEKAI